MKEISTQEQIARIHNNCEIENGFILVPVESFGYLASGQNYRIIETGDEIKVTGKRSGDGSGKKTIYIAEVNGEPFEGSIEDLKDLLKIDYRRPKGASSNAKTALGKLEFEVSNKVANLVGDCATEVTADEFSELKNAYKQFRGLVGIFRKAQQAAAEKAAAEKAAAERAKKETEKADKSADKMSDEALLAELKKRGLI